MDKLQIINSSEFGIEEKKALTIEQSFLPKKQEFDGYVDVYRNVISMDIEAIETSKKARELRLKLVKVRTGIKDVHQAEKAFFLASGKYVDALKNKLTLPVEQMEEKLLEIEKYQENKEKERKAKLKLQRIELLTPYDVDTTFVDLENMGEDQFNSFYETNKTAYEAKQEAERLSELKRIEEEKKAEEERKRLEKEREEERKRLEEENRKLKEQQEIERKKQEAERQKQELQLKKEREAAEKLRIEKEEQIKAEREKSLKIQRELEAKQEAERLEKERIEKEKRDKLLAPDKEKINQLYLSIKNFDFPNVIDLESKKIIDSVKEDFNEILKKIILKSKSLK